MPYDDLPDDYFDEYGRPPVLNQHDYAEGMPDPVRDEVAREEAAARMSLVLDSMAAQAAEDERRAAAARAASPVAREMDRGVPPRAAAGGVVAAGGGAHPGGLRVPGTIPGYYWESTPAPHPIWLDGTIMNPISTEQFLMYPYMNMFNQRTAAAPAAPAPKKGGGAPARKAAAAPAPAPAPSTPPSAETPPLTDPGMFPSHRRYAEYLPNTYDRETAITSQQADVIRQSLETGVSPTGKPLSASQRRNYNQIFDSYASGRGATEWSGIRGDDQRQAVTDYLYGGMAGYGKLGDAGKTPLGAVVKAQGNRYDSYGRPVYEVDNRFVRPQEPRIMRGSKLVDMLNLGR